MSLYLCIFDEDEEMDGVDIGAYSDFDDFRKTIGRLLESDKTGAQFPTLLLHSDCEGEWSVEDCKKLEGELMSLATKLKQLPPKMFFSEWQVQKAKQLGLRPETLYDCFMDVDGEPLVERLIELAKLAQRRNLPILFQ